MFGGQVWLMDRSGEWTEVVSVLEWSVEWSDQDWSNQWTEVVSGLEWLVNFGG